MRGKRKLEHINGSLLLYDKNKNISSKSNIRFVPCELPEKNLTKIDLSTIVCQNIRWPNYLYINSSTGGTLNTFPILNELASVANNHQLALAVGSQTAMFEENTHNEYRKIRKRYPHLHLIANTSANSNFHDAAEMIDVLGAEILQVHLNLGQEAVMPEGDRDFRHQLDNIRNFQEKLSTPIIIKGVGNGISKETFCKLKKIAIAGVDVGGRDGTNFVNIENARRKQQIALVNNWGLTTYESLLDLNVLLNQSKVDLWASGGVYKPYQAVVCMSLGAKAVGIITPILSFINNKQHDEADIFLNRYLEDTKTLLRMLSCSNISDLTKKSIIISGDLYQFCQQRNIDIKRFANR